VQKRIIVAVGSAVVAVVALRPGTAGYRRLRRGGRWLGSRARHVSGWTRGVAYRLARHHPDEDVPDPVLADRVRSALGPVERRLDLPHIHVMVQDHIALLHGDVASEGDRETLERAVRDVSGVRGVESHLHIGLLRSDTRPSEGRAQPQRSDQRRRLEAAAEQAGATSDPARAARAALGYFCERMPPNEYAQVLAHLPADVRLLTQPVRRHDPDAARIRTVDELVAAVADADPDLDIGQARRVTEAVLGELAALVPEERSDVAATLPRELRDLWTHTI
jgi:uncharacterized protein (DUF2267 family)